MRYALVVLFAALVGCPPPPPVVVTPVDGPWPASPEGACYALAALRCPEALPAIDGTTCPMVIRKAQRLLDMKLACIVAAADVASVRACGTVRCRE